MRPASTPSPIEIARCDADGLPARRMRQALWAEIEGRYGFTAADPFQPGDADVAGGGLWIACADGAAVGSIALLPLSESSAELDVMYVAASHRRRGIANALLWTLEDHARSAGFTELLLRAGAPQPEALAFYGAAGFEPTNRFGRWTHDDSALCFRKMLLSC